MVASVPGRGCGAVWPLYNPLRPATLPGRAAVRGRAAGPRHNPAVCGQPLRPRTAHNGGHGHGAAEGPPQPTATPPPWSCGAQWRTGHRTPQCSRREQCEVQARVATDPPVTKSCGRHHLAPPPLPHCGGSPSLSDHHAPQRRPPALQHVPLRAPAPAPPHLAPRRHVQPRALPPPHGAPGPPAPPGRGAPQAQVPLQDAPRRAQPEGEVRVRRVPQATLA